MENQFVLLVCDREGVITRVLRDDLNLGERVRSKSSLACLVESAERDSFAHFMEALQVRRQVYDWEIKVLLGDIRTPLYFAGTKIDNGFLLMATRSRNGLVQLNEELMRINNDQTNELRAKAQSLSRANKDVKERDDFLYAELTHVNNEMANLQRELAKKNAELAKLNDQKNRLLGMAAHDLRSPLGIILNYSEFLEEEAFDALDEEQREFVSTIKKMSEFMLGIVGDLVDMSAIESGQLKLDIQAGDLGDLIRQNVKLNRVLAARKEIAIEYEPPLNLPLVRFDRGKTEQVINNLISNATKFSHRGTAVRVRLSCSEGFATVAIEDQGQGIPAEELPKLFKPFSRSSVRATGGEQSTGLGLAIVHRIVKEHGGKIWIDSAVGRGSTFFFTLPIEPVASS